MKPEEPKPLGAGVLTCTLQLVPPLTGHRLGLYTLGTASNYLAMDGIRLVSSQQHAYDSKYPGAGAGCNQSYLLVYLYGFILFMPVSRGVQSRKGVQVGG